MGAIGFDPSPCFAEQIGDVSIPLRPWQLRGPPVLLASAGAK